MKPFNPSKEMEAKSKPLQPQKDDPEESKNKSENRSTMEVFDDCQSLPASTSRSKKNVTEEDIQIVQNLIEGCLVKYMNRNQVIKVLRDQERIDPVFTTLVWQRLEEQNAEFFRNYYSRLELIKQISIFNKFLGWQYDMMQNLSPPNAVVNSIPANNLPMLHANHSPQSAGISSNSTGDTTRLDGTFLALPDITNLADVGDLEKYTGSPYLTSYPTIDSPRLLMRYITDIDIDEEKR